MKIGNNFYVIKKTEIISFYIIWRGLSKNKTMIINKNSVNFYITWIKCLLR
jgi:hypothetical protein